MGPAKAARYVKEKNPAADYIEVVLYGSLAKTGAGHRTDVAIKNALSDVGCNVVFNKEKTNLPHPNTMEVTVFENTKQIGFYRIFSIGGGTIQIEGDKLQEMPDIYPYTTFTETVEYCKQKQIRIWQYVEQVEGPAIWDFLFTVWQAMKNSISEGISQTGTLPGGLGIQRKANYLYNQIHMDETAETRENRLVSAYAFAVSEQNASGNVVVTAPTCGASGVLPAVLFYISQKKGFDDKQVLKALATGGLIGNLIKTNASISGAECGCQAEIGSACSMASAALAELFHMDFDQIEYAAEVAMEHHLGLTCDPIKGLVQIPCIERNAVAAMRAINALSLANFLSGTRKISFDLVIKTMYETGKDLSKIYRETSEGGLAKLYQ